MAICSVSIGRWGSTNYTAFFAASLLFPLLKQVSAEAASVPGYDAYAELSCVVCGAPRDRSVYVRWGRATCPSNSTVVSVGWTAGSSQQDPGGGSDYLCMASSANPIDAVSAANSNGADLFVYVELSDWKKKGHLGTSARQHAV